MRRLYLGLNVKFVINRRKHFAMKLSFLFNEGVEFCNCPRKAGKSTILGAQFPQPKPSIHSGSSAKVISTPRPVPPGLGSKASGIVFVGEIPDVITPY